VDDLTYAGTVFIGFAFFVVCAIGAVCLYALARNAWREWRKERKARRQTRIAGHMIEEVRRGNLGKL